MKLKATGECRGMSGIGPAFTLIEVLIAIGILALVMTAIYASWVAVLRASKVGNTSLFIRCTAVTGSFEG